MQCKVKMDFPVHVLLNRILYHIICWKAAMGIHSLSSSSIPIFILLFPLPLPFPWDSNCHCHSRGNPMRSMGCQLFLFPWTSLLSTSMLCRPIKVVCYTTVYRFICLQLSYASSILCWSIKLFVLSCLYLEVWRSRERSRRIRHTCRRNASRPARCGPA